MPRQYMRAPPAERFWPKVDTSGDCWIWTAFVNQFGYGQFNDGSYRAEKAHRFAWMLATGEMLSPGEHVAHVCDNRLCVRNDDVGTYEVAGMLLPRRGHLFKATNLDNILDSMQKGRRERVKKTQCRQGHELSGDNVVIGRLVSGLLAQRCRQCLNAWRREHRKSRAQREGSHQP